MAKETQESQQNQGIGHVGKHKRGYDAKQVDDFLETAHAKYDAQDVSLTVADIQNAAFRLVKGGYVIGQVDAALSRLGRAVADRQTLFELNGDGSKAWKKHTESMYRLLAAHASREPQERFARGKAKKPSYSVKQVDQLVDMILNKAGMELGVLTPSDKETKKLADVNSVRVANAIFTQRKGKKGYDERQVDYYLATCCDLLNRLESYERLKGTVVERDAADSATEETRVVPPITSGVTQNSQTYASQTAVSGVPVPPLFAEHPAPSYASGNGDDDDRRMSFVRKSTSGNGRSQSTADDSKASFEDMQRQEEEIFKSPQAQGFPVNPVSAGSERGSLSGSASSTPASPSQYPVSSDTASSVTGQRGQGAEHRQHANDGHVHNDLPAGIADDGNSSLAALEHASKQKTDPVNASENQGDHNENVDTMVISPTVPTLGVPAKDEHDDVQAARQSGESSRKQPEVAADDWLFVPHDDEFEIPNLIFPDIASGDDHGNDDGTEGNS